MDRLYLADEHDAHVHACYDADEPRTALCAWCRHQIELCERAAVTLAAYAAERSAPWLKIKNPNDLS